MAQKLTCVAIDKDAQALDLLNVYCQYHDAIELLATYNDAEPAIKFLQYNEADLVVADIGTPGIDGLTLAETLQNEHMLIFTSAQANPSVTSFELKAIDYLLKPFDMNRFNKAIAKAIARKKKAGG